MADRRVDARPRHRGCFRPLRSGRAQAPGEGGDRGASTTETALITPLLLLLIMGAIQFALAEHAQHIAQAAAVRALADAQAQDGTAADGQAAGDQALQQLAGHLLQHPQLTVTRNPTQVTATVHGRALSLIPGLHLPVTAHAAGPVERLTTPTGP
jgi:hypothetical protein